jgi:hypothetical protein
MHTFEQKPKAAQQTAPPKITFPTRAHVGQSQQVNTSRNRILQPLQNSTPGKQRFAFDFSQIPVYARGIGGTPLDAVAQTRMRLQQGAAAGHSQDDPLGSSASNPSAAAHPAIETPLDDAQGLSSSPKIAELKLITTKAGAFSGFPIAKGIDLNVPGPFNDTTTIGSCVNVHQMQFRLSRGEPREVKLIRKVIRVAVAGGTEHRKGEKNKPADDGPSEGSVIRPKDSSSVVVADAPGFIGKGDAGKSTNVFPVSYDADFQLFATDAVDPRLLAKMEYTVSVAKKSFGDTAPKNEITEKSRKLF